MDALPGRDPGLDVLSAVGTWDNNVCVEQTGRAVLASESITFKSTYRYYFNKERTSIALLFLILCMHELVQLVQ